MRRYLLDLAWVIALVATIGSLFFSEILQFAPCKLCWYQRMFMYPLTFIIPIGVLKKDPNLFIYILTLAGVGGVIALYHTLLQMGVLSSQLAPCEIGTSCLTRYTIPGFGYINIPLLSLLSFLGILVCGYFSIRKEGR